MPTVGGSAGTGPWAATGPASAATASRRRAATTATTRGIQRLSEPSAAWSHEPAAAVATSRAPDRPTLTRETRALAG